MATLKSFKGFIPMELGLGRHYINGFVYVDDSNQSYYVQTDNSKAYLVSSDVINYYPEVSFPKVRRLVLDPSEFNLTLDEVIDITEAEVTQHQITNYFADTLAEAKALTYKKQERVKIFELDEVYECVEIQNETAVGNASGSIVEDGSTLYMASHDGGGLGQLLVREAGVTRALYTFTASDTSNTPHGSSLKVGNKIYLETFSGGANGNGQFCEFNLLTNTLTGLFDFGSTNGTDTSQSNLHLVSDADILEHNGFIYLLKSRGGANNLGTFLKYEVSTGLLTVIDLNSADNNRAPAKGFSTIYNNEVFAFHGRELLIYNTLTSTYTNTNLDTLTTNTFASGNGVKNGIRHNDEVFVQYGLTGVSSSAIRYDLATKTVLGDIVVGGALFGGYISFIDASKFYAFNNTTYNVSEWDYVSNPTNNTYVANSSNHSLTGSIRGYNGNYIQSSNCVYYTRGNGGNLQTEAYKYDISAKTETIEHDFSTSSQGVNADDEYLIEIDQSDTANLYLRVRDNHLKSIALDATGKGLDVTTTRGVTSNIVFPTVNGFDAYNTDIFTGGTGDQTTLTANTISDMVLTNSAPALTSSDFLPNGIDQIYDFTNNRLDFGSAGLSATSTLTLDFSYLFNQDDDDSILDFVIEFTENNGSTFTKELSVGFTDEGAGQDIEQVTRVSFFIGPNSTNGTAVIKLRSDADATFTLKTLTIYTHI